MSNSNIEAYFKIVKGKVVFKAKNKANDKKIALTAITSVDEALEGMLKEVSVSIFDLVDIFKEGLAMKALGQRTLGEAAQLTFGKDVYSITNARSLGEVLAQSPDETIKNLRGFYFKYFKKEFNVAYLKHLGFNEKGVMKNEKA